MIDRRRTAVPLSSVAARSVDPPAAVTGGHARVPSRRQFFALSAGLVAAVATIGSDRSGAVLPELVQRCCFGAYADNEPYPVDAHFALEQRVGGTPLPVCSWFVEFGSEFPSGAAALVAARGGHDLLVAWEAHGISFDEILAGAHDEYIWRFVRDAGGYPGAVVLRPFHESNCDWYDWAPASGRGYVRDADQWIATWRHVVDVARRAGRPNVRFAWCVSSHDTTRSLEALWPGPDTVDVLGIDAYGWTAGSRFDSLMDDVYDRVADRHPSAPVWVCELGLADQSMGAADFYRSVYGARAYPRLTAVCWFDKDQFAITADSAGAAVHRDQLRRARRAVQWI